MALSVTENMPHASAHRHSILSQLQGTASKSDRMPVFTEREVAIEV